MPNAPYPADLEYKNTKGTLLGYTASPLPHDDRTGPALTAAEIADSKAAVGSPAQGNGLTNSAMRSLGAGIDAPPEAPAAPAGLMAAAQEEESSSSSSSNAPANAPASKSSAKRSS